VSDADEKGDTVKPTQLLQQAGQSIWLDNIERCSKSPTHDSSTNALIRRYQRIKGMA
jgi:hypothetical protein